MKPGFLILFFVLTALTGCKKNTPAFLQEKLVGTWSGTVVNTSIGGGNSWDVTFTFEENGHYTGAITTIHYGDPHASTYVGQDDKDHLEKKLVIHYLDSFGKGHGTIKNYYDNGGSIHTMSIHDLEFTDDYNKLTFELYYGPAHYYTLTRN